MEIWVPERVVVEDPELKKFNLFSWAVLAVTMRGETHEISGVRSLETAS
jgi:hypothetical protein